MLISMTGYGISSGEACKFRFRIEARSLNHRFFELKTRMPQFLAGLEPELEALARKYFERGRIELLVSIEAEPEKAELSWSKPLAKAYLEAFRQMKKELGLSGEPDLELLINQKDVIISGPERWGKEFWPELEPLFVSCFEELAKLRRLEGRRLEKDLKQRLRAIDQIRRVLERKQELAVKEARARLEKRLEQILGKGLELDPGRLEQEVVILAMKSDVGEELERIASHLKQFSLELKSPGPKGKKLDFLVQELSREFNTIGAKSQNAELSQAVVEAKSELERIRQQLQNIE